MILYGKEYGLFFSTRAYEVACEVCPGGDFARLSDVLTGTDKKSAVAATKKIVVAMSRAYWRRQMLESGIPVNQWTEPDVLTEELLDDISFAEWSDLQKEAFAAIGRDSETKVETEAEKKTGEPA